MSEPHVPYVVPDSAITTLSGHAIDFLAPSPAAIALEDIARGLSRIPRWCGHTDQVWSVAEHCILVSKLLPPEFRLQALLHDAAEAYTGDIPTPLKRLLPEFEAIETRLLGAIFRALGTDRMVIEESVVGDPIRRWRPVVGPQVWHADKLALGIEGYWLRGRRGENPAPEVNPLRPMNNPDVVATWYMREYERAYEFAMNWKWRNVRPAVAS